mmetsp:Transcript_13907/g.18247  ORF Transcript_13907/g.18247 Transcript_13907/m.18247 type:complete len:535 (+) Transcript_13907:116-1720(+)
MKVASFDYRSMQRPHLTSRRQEVNRRLNECWRLREEKTCRLVSDPSSQSLVPNFQAPTDSTALRFLKSMATWLRFITPKQKNPNPKTKVLSKISDEIALDLKKALDSRKVAKTMAESLSILLQNQSKNVRVCDAENTVLEIGKQIIAKNHMQGAFAMVDLARIAWNLIHLKDEILPLTPRFSVGQNSDPMVLLSLAASGIGFNCRSKGDLDAVSTVLRSKGLALAGRVFDCNPCKPHSYLNQLVREGVLHWCADSTQELKRIAIAHSKAKQLVNLPQLHISIQLDTICCSCGSDREFCTQCLMEESVNIARSGMLLGIKRFGLSFTVGKVFIKNHQNQNLETELSQILNIITQISSALEQLIGIKPDIVLDGGDLVSLEDWRVIKTCVAETRSEDRVAVDASQLLLEESIHIVARLQGKRGASNPADPTYAGMQYYIDDGCYGTFSSVVLEKVSVNPIALDPRGDQIKSPVLKASTVWGPTCDGIDCVVKVAALPDLNLGDWILFQGLGVGAQVSKVTKFNGLDSCSSVYCIRR